MADYNVVVVVVVFDLNTLEALNYIGACFVFGFAWVFSFWFFLGLAFVGNTEITCGDAAGFSLCCSCCFSCRCCCCCLWHVFHLHQLKAEI